MWARRAVAGPRWARPQVVETAYGLVFGGSPVETAHGLVDVDLSPLEGGQDSQTVIGLGGGVVRQSGFLGRVGVGGDAVAVERSGHLVSQAAEGVTLGLQLGDFEWSFGLVDRLAGRSRVSAPVGLSQD